MIESLPAVVSIFMLFVQLWLLFKARRFYRQADRDCNEMKAIAEAYRRILGAQLTGHRADAKDLAVFHVGYAKTITGIGQ